MKLHPYGHSQGVCLCRRVIGGSLPGFARYSRPLQKLAHQSAADWWILCALSDLELLHIKANKEDGVSEEQASVSFPSLTFESSSSGLHPAGKEKNSLLWYTMGAGHNVTTPT